MKLIPKTGLALRLNFSNNSVALQHNIKIKLKLKMHTWACMSISIYACRVDDVFSKGSLQIDAKLSNIGFVISFNQGLTFIFNKSLADE